ncbi:MAG: alpha-hydroxy-acid oxidizing protein [Chloroflexi bacterium]|nr:alpha-hydroxy-acid oxidizing protein [Chloroflexota bacterium]
MRQRPAVPTHSLGDGANPVNLFELEELAREKIPPEVWDYFAGGAEDEITLAENHRAFQRVKLRPRLGVDVSKRDLSTQLFGQKIGFPVLLAPTSYQKLAHPEGELAVARAAASAGTIVVLGTGNYYSVDDVAAISDGPRWFQMYCFNNNDVTERAIRRAEAAGCGALVVTIDGSDRRRFERLIRRPLVVSPQLGLLNLVGLGLDDTLLEQEGGLNKWLRTLVKLDPTWDDIAWIKSVSRIPVVLKGIMSPHDALRAIELGVDGIIVSNHGGRQVDGALASIEALPEIAEAVDGRMEILLDSGVRRGTDVLKALALGAKAVLVGRPLLWGLAVGGEAGVRRMLEMLREELDGAMAQTGQTDVKKVPKSLVTVRKY